MHKLYNLKKTKILSSIELEGYGHLSTKKTFWIIEDIYRDCDYECDCGECECDCNWQCDCDCRHQ